MYTLNCIYFITDWRNENFSSRKIIHLSYYDIGDNCLFWWALMLIVMKFTYFVLPSEWHYIYFLHRYINGPTPILACRSTSPSCRICTSFCRSDTTESTTSHHTIPTSVSPLAGWTIHSKRWTSGQVWSTS